jgi:hypothetical protein
MAAAPASQSIPEPQTLALLVWGAALCSLADWSWRGPLELHGFPG